ncbi:GlxA family transcriptional regulator [Cupriavidus plantarum]|uniref:GlxA family transcriptional regulator n=1 Tax=Cupriavidus plantarum TaxID=942865 RepID=UPI001B1433AA|nr:GlxA family transcriptional regulator [Cupriavidus plantarum]CAG2127983.1 HTH-type transcriptional regulator CdhR [Cupriavidus plantarum]SMR66839.1 transcriptional regulator, AraC family with amidase-like domain [Cupriavidus plantarum]
MRRIGLILEHDFQLIALSALSVFDLANAELGEEGYRISILSPQGGLVRSTIRLGIETEPLETIPDTLIVAGANAPATTPDIVKASLSRAAGLSKRIAAFSTGTFALAEAGLLDGRTATTHWLYARLLQERFPGVRVDEDRIFVRDGQIWTSAGMSAAIDLALALVEDDHGAAIALNVARRLVVYHRRTGCQPQLSALLELKPRSDRVRLALTYAKEHLRSPLTVEELADAARLSPRQFSRVFREETGLSPAKAVEMLRLEAAKAMLESGRYSMDLIARDTGFFDRDRMRRAFLRAYGEPPKSVSRHAGSGSNLGEGIGLAIPDCVL